MRLRINLSCEKGVVVNYNYNHYLHAVIAKAADGKAERRNLPFTFSQLYFDRYDIARAGIVNLGSCIQWYISSSHIEFLQLLREGFKRNKIIDLGCARLPVQDIKVLTDPEIHGLMEFSCMSPITVIKGKGRQRFGRLGDNDFNTLLRQDLLAKYYQLHRSLPADDQLEFEFNQRYMQNRRRVSRLINYRDTKIMGYMVPFLVRGNPDLIRVGYQLGFGHNNNHGFGMVKVWHRTNLRVNEKGTVECG